ncbi:hypothetical protein IVB38_34815 [Bradyrhizobium sp. 38]|uniref:hypothetical protein n=1 Tax=unclassified Bradyrhizobium TaxID=2631580 RepID=UPI001FF964FA|nr:MULTISPECIES: hypothetical protein [unclassified Bradyrhizobium]MCK1341052.1 hypothetical protein [Bradyrhizobium sp. 38]MCK1780940.1 hypothetical protein [Bradyrhizobium sp. 132]
MDRLLHRHRPLPGMPGVAGVPANGGKLVAPTAADQSFAPFVPRSTPKNGESDGL